MQLPTEAQTKIGERAQRREKLSDGDVCAGTFSREQTDEKR